jgi:uncharacterized membrane protein YhaH (DUF805 family)
MNFTEAVKSGFRNYLNFNGRAARSEFWLWVLFTALGGIGSYILDTAIFVYHSDAMMNSPLNDIFSLVTLLPSLTITVRRLHDIDRSGWWALLLLTIVGTLWLIYWQCQPGTEGRNRFGEDPLAGLRAVSPE